MILMVTGCESLYRDVAFAFDSFHDGVRYLGLGLRTFRLFSLFCGLDCLFKQQHGFPGHL